MKKYLVLAIGVFGLLGCKDEFNLPEYNSFVDSTPPSITVISPAENDTLTSTNVSLNYELRDDYKLKEFTVRIIPSDISLPEYTDVVQIDDSVYTYFKQYTLPKDTPLRYEVNLSLQDSLGFGSNKVYFFNYQ